MANLNLSQFTEKTFVADADWTFVWDTVGAISKKVSRNNWLNSGTLTTSAPVTISQTWDALAVAFTAFKVNATSTNSAAGSLLLDLQTGGTSVLNVRKDGLTTITAINFNNGTYGGDANWWAPSGLNILGTSYISFGAADVRIYRDAANTLALRNGTNAQTFNVYGTYTASPLAYSRLAIACDTSGNATLTTQSTGVAGTVSINGVPVGLGRLNVATSVAVGTGALVANTSALGGNTAIGNSSLLAATNIYWSTAIGYRALAGLNDFSTSNVAVGYEAGSQITSGANFQCSSSVFIGYDTKALGNNQTNQIVIGASTTGLGSNTAVLGNASITTTALRGNVGIGTTAPSSKLQVTGGDVEIETVTSGIIMKAAGTSTRYRITLNAGGTALVFTAI